MILSLDIHVFFVLYTPFLEIVIAKYFFCPLVLPVFYIYFVSYFSFEGNIVKYLALQTPVRVRILKQQSSSVRVRQSRLYADFRLGVIGSVTFMFVRVSSSQGNSRYVRV